MKIRAILLTALLCSALSSPLQAGQQEGVNAYKAGDYATAYREFMYLAERGDAAGQYWVGKMLSSGKGVEKNYAEALKWYRLAATQGYAKAQYGMGDMYFLGYGVSPDPAEAVKWFRQAVEQGESFSQHRLGQMYEKGVGVEQDYVKAHMLFSLALEGGVRKSRRSRNFLEEKMTSEQIELARRLASEWTPGAAKTAAKL